MRRTLLKFRNPDSTRDINDKLTKLVHPGVIDGGTFEVVPGTFKVELSPWKIINADGMVIEETSIYQRFECPAGQITVIYLLSQYVSNNIPIVDVAAIDSITFDLLPNPEKYIEFGRFNVPPGSSQVLISHRVLKDRDITDSLQRSKFRGFLTSQGDLPLPSDHQVGDFFLVADGIQNPAIWALRDQTTWVDLTTTLFLSSQLAQHRANGFANEKHLTEDEKAAMSGTSGEAPSSVNPFIDNADNRIPSQSENEALAGSDGTPSNLNRYVTQDFFIAEPSSVTLLPTASEFIAPTVIKILDAAKFGDTYVGKEGTAKNYFTLYNPNLEREYIDGLGNFISVEEVYTDVALTIPLDPSVSSLVDINGFVNATTPLYLKLNFAPTSAFDFVFGKKRNLKSLNKGSLLKRGPRVQDSNAIMQKIVEVKGRQFDDVPPNFETNFELRKAAVNTKQYLNAVLNGDFVVHEFSKIKTIPFIGENFKEKDVGLNVYEYQKPLTVTYSKISDDTVQYSASIPALTAGFRYVFIDGLGREFPLDAATPQPTLATLKLAKPSLINTISTSPFSGYIKRFSNISEYNQSRLQASSDRVTILARRVVDKTITKQTGSGLPFALSAPIRDSIAGEPSVSIEGAVQNFGQDKSSVLRITGPVSIHVTGRFRYLKLMVQNLVGPGATFTVTKFPEGTAILGAYQVPLSPVSNSAYFVSPVFIDFGTVDFRSATIASTSTTSEWYLHGIQLLNDHGNHTQEPGRCFVQNDLFELNAPVSTPLIPVGGAQRGSVAIDYVSRSINLSRFYSNLADLDGTLNTPGGTVGAPASTSLFLATGTAKGELIKAGSIVRIHSATAERTLKVSSVTGTIGSRVLNFATSLNLSGPVIVYNLGIFGQTSFSDLEDREYRRILLKDAGVGLAGDWASIDTNSTSKYYAYEDATTSIQGSAVRYTSNGVDGADIAVLMENLSSKITFTGVFSRLDIITANSSLSAISTSVSIDGSDSQNLTLSSYGYSRTTVVSGLRYQSHEVVFSKQGLLLVGFVLFEPKPDTEIESLGALLSTRNMLATYLPSKTTSDVMPIGALKVLPNIYGYSVINGVGSGTQDWKFLRPNFISADKQNSIFEFFFNDTAIEVGYFSSSNLGIVEILLNNIPVSGVGMFGFSSGSQVDQYSSTGANKKFGIYNLPTGRKSLKIRCVGARNVASSGNEVNITSIYECNQTGLLSATPAKDVDFYAPLNSVRDERNFDSGANTFVPVQSVQTVLTQTRSGSVSVSGTAASIAFSSPLPSADYAVSHSWFYSEAASGNPIIPNLIIRDQTTDGFDCEWSSSLPAGGGYVLKYTAMSEV